ncbi:MAG TPA: outer membrane beta-barrel protein [Pyrinomonadaceae bacterium]|jgi:opacity protein-like surface antigen
MPRLLLAALLIAGCAAASTAQTAAPYPKNELFVGYSYEDADVNSLTVNPGRAGLHGVNFEYTRNVNRVVGVTADFSGHIKRESFATAAASVRHDREQYNLLGGLQFKARNRTRATPFAHALLGGGLFRGFSAVLSPASNTFFFDDAKSFAAAFGGGLDIRAGRRVTVRALQADYNPTFFGRSRQNNFRLSFGVVFTR